jgi:tetratricopeptide (TPR) repeat protein
VKVHQEVRDHGMVVDPGCMKCLDCISVCPNDALYFGFGAPAIVSTVAPKYDKSSKRRELARGLFALALVCATWCLIAMRASPPGIAPTIATGFVAWKIAAACTTLCGIAAVVIVAQHESRAQLARRALAFAFMFAASFVFASYSGDLSAYTLANQGEVLPVAGALALLSFFVVGTFESRAERASEYSLAEETLLGAFFLLAMLAFRGLSGWVPFLFALGLAAILAYAAVQSLRMFYRRDLSFARTRVKLAGKLTRGGVACAAVLVLVGAGWALAGAKQRELSAAASEMLRTRESAHSGAVLARQVYNEGVQSATDGRIDEAIEKFRRALELDAHFTDARENLAGMLCASGRMADGLAQYELALSENPNDADTHAFAARAAAALNDLSKSREHLLAATRLAPERSDLWSLLAEVEAARGDKAASDVARKRAEHR